jgi:hypothetical protein
MKSTPLIVLFFLLNLPGSQVRADTGQPRLFEESSTLELTLDIDLDELCRPREDPDCDYEPSQLSWQEHGETRSIPVEFIVRGGWRSLSANCQVPLLFLRFAAEETLGTPFEGQKSLPLTTHCGRSSLLDDQALSSGYVNYEQYLLKEYLAYRMYNVISDLSLRVRLVSILYENPEKPGKGRRNFAFFTEHFESLAARSETELLQRDRFDHERLELRQADRVALFEFMIGNTDWSIARQRNIILLQDAEKVQWPVPYDLDMSGLVNAPYAGPPPSLPIDEVTQRYYLGYCHPEADWNSLFIEFKSNRSALQNLIPEVPGLVKKEKTSSRRYLDKFFRILKSPKKRDKYITGACQPWPPSREDHMAPANLNP